MAETIQSVMKDPVGFVEELTDLEKYAKLAGQWDNLHKIFADSLEQQMRVQNPYWDLENDTFVDGQRARYEQFRGGYYVGMLLFEVALEATGAGAADKLADFKKVQQFASKPRVAKALRYTQKASKYTPSAVVMRNGGKVARLVARRSGIDADFASSVVARGKTVGKQWRVAQAAKRLDGTKFADLSDAGKETLASYVFSHGEAAVEVVTTVDFKTAKRLLGDSCSGTSSRVYSGAGGSYRGYSTLCGQELREKLADLADDHDFDSATFDDFADNLRNANGDTAREAYELADAEGETGVRLANDVLESDIPDGSQDELLTILREGDDAGVSPDYDREDFVNDADELSDLKSFKEQLKAPSGNDDKGLKGIAGEAKVASEVRELDGVEVEEVGEDLDPEDIDAEIPDDGFKQGTEIDIKVNGKFEANGKTLDSPWIESKNWNHGNEFFYRRGINQLVEKLRTQALVKDDLVVVLPERAIKDMKHMGKLGWIRDRVKNRVDSDVTIEFVSYDEL